MAAASRDKAAFNARLGAVYKLGAMDGGDVEVPQELYDSEINFSIACLWDAGFEVSLGRAPHFDDETEIRTYREACWWLKEAAMRHYPEPEFAKKHRGPANSDHAAPARRAGRRVSITEE